MNVSLQHRLLWLLLSVITSVWLLACWSIYKDTQDEVEELFDGNLAQTAKVLYRLLEHEILDHDNAHFLTQALELKHRYERKIAFSVRNNAGELLASSSNILKFPAEMDSDGYHDYIAKPYNWRVFTFKAKYGLVQTAERYDVRNELVNEVSLHTLKNLLFALPLLAILIWLSIGRGLKPLKQITYELTLRTHDQLQPVSTQAVPVEIKSVIDALNSLFQRLENAFENERRFTADAAHELRTPLSGLKVQAQVALRSEDPQVRQQALQKILIGVDHASHLVSQLLTLARMDSPQPLSIKTIDLQKVVQQVLNNLMEKALEKNQDLGLMVQTENTLIQGNAEALEILLRNFVDNALRYTPELGEVTVSIVQVAMGALCLSVSDNGIGIAPEQREKIFERFYRGNHQHIQGSGLGLSIVQRIAELHNLRIELCDPPQGSGLVVNVYFPVVEKLDMHAL
ncbi:MAG: ATP-binding protein [Thiotrichaceae bacterium]|nr:ATP-binding protein [Thiotrichaceae bacterium]